ncbi:MAG: hypothetical protein A2Z01_05010 [Betaproteobacteria bacterium RBG_16_58_11]|nr:MAG: hypothetical protein A2Z01_05010 [Betaproteobacteria bacterium RBG_16_58_11]
MAETAKNVSIMCFHDELCQVFNALMTALSLLRQGAKVTVYFASRGINAVHKERMRQLTCLPDQPEAGEAVMKRMDELDLPLVEDLFFMFIAEGGVVLACPLNLSLFGMSERDLVDGVKVADPATYYRDVVIPADMNLTF